MALIRSRSAELFPNKTVNSTTRQLQQALYHLLDDPEKGAFIEALGVYRARMDIFELVNTLRKVLNTPVKRQLFPLVRKVIRQEHVEAFDLITRDVKQTSSVTIPSLYRPHMADLNVLNKYRASRHTARPRHPLVKSWAGTAATTTAAAAAGDRPADRQFHKSATIQRVGARTGYRDAQARTSDTLFSSRDLPEGQTLQIDIGEPDTEDDGFGFTIRGGAELGVGVYVSSVDSGSPAQKQGLVAGDLILEANNISFSSISHEEAARILKAATRLQVTVSRVGRIPSSHAVHQAYTWTDPKGRPVSPPADGNGGALGDDDERRRSASQMLKGSDERKINIMLQKTHGLGIMIRGGREYGLGIFVSGIAPFSVAENAGVKLGDQILDVNGQSFLDITHAEAVKILQSSRHLILTVKDVGKIPFAKTTIDERGWIESTRLGSYANSLSWSSRKSVNGSLSDQEVKKKIFSRGVGTQLMLTSHLGKAKQKEQIYDQAKLLLNDSEHATLNYYLAEYDKKTINIRGMAHALLELLNTPAKLTLVSDIRAVVRPADLTIFDQLITRKDLEKSLDQARKLLAPDMLSLSSFDSDVVAGQEQYKRTMFSHPRHAPEKVQPMEVLDLYQEAELESEIPDLLETSRRLTRSTPDLTNLQHLHDSLQQSRSRSRSRSPWSEHPNHLNSNSTDPNRSVDSADDLLNNDLHQARPKETNFKEFSDPQKKILTRLELKKPLDEVQTKVDKNVRNHHTASSTSWRPVVYNSVEHVAEVYEPPSFNSDSEDIQDASDLSVVNDDHRPFSYPAGQVDNRTLSSKGISRRQQHRGRLKDRSRSRSKSQVQSGPDVDNISGSGQIGPSTQRSAVVVVNGDQQLSRNHSSVHQNGGNSNATSKQTSAVFSVSLKPHTRKDKSPFKQIWGNFKHTGNSSSTTRNQHGTLTINGQQISPAASDNKETSTFPSQWEQEHDDEEEDDLKENGVSMSSENHNHQTPVTDTSHMQMNEITTAFKPVISSNKSKGALLVKARKNSSNETSPIKVGGVSTSRYKSPRRDKQISKINVPLIKIDADPNVRSDGTQQTPELGKDMGDVGKEGKYLTIIKHNGMIQDGGKSTTRITILDQAADMEAALPSGGRNPTSQRKNVTSLSVGGLLNREPPERSWTSVNMDGCLGQISFRLPRPEVYTPVELAIIDDMNQVEAIKRKAREKYGEIPLDIVYVYRSKPTLGVAIEGGANTRQPLPKVISVQPGGSAFESGGLKVGHVILEVNGQPVVGLSHMDAARLIAETFKNIHYNRMELLVTEWSDRLLDAITVDVGMLQLR